MTTPLIEIKNLHVCVEGNKILKGVDLTVQKGEVHSIMGPNGSGKSTLASLMPRFFDVEEGSVTFDGVDVRDVALDDLRSRIGIVPQEPMLFGGTVRDNLVYGHLEATICNSI